MPIIILALIITIYYIIAHQWYTQIGISIDRLRAAGLPTTPAEIIGEPIPDEDNSAPIFKEIDQQIAEDTERYWNEQQVLDFFGSRDRRVEIWDRAKELVEQRANLFALIEEAARRPQFWVPCEPIAKELLTSLDVLSEAPRHSVRLLAMRSTLRAADGDMDGAVADVIASLKIGSAWSMMRCVMGSIGRAAMINLSLKAMIQLFEYGKLDEPHVQRLYNECTAIDLDAEHTEAVRGETAFLTSAYQYGWKLIFMPYTMYQTTSAIAALERQLAESGPDLSKPPVNITPPPGGPWGASAALAYINVQKYITESSIACIQAFLIVSMYQEKHQRLPQSLEKAESILGVELHLDPFTGSKPVYSVTDQGFDLRCPGREGVQEAVIKAKRNQFGKWNYDLQLASLSVQP